MKSASLVHSGRKQRKGNKKIFFASTRKIAKIRVFSLNFGNDIILWFHFFLQKVLFLLFISQNRVKIKGVEHFRERKRL